MIEAERERDRSLTKLLPPFTASTMGSISKLSDEIIASIFAYGADIRIGEPRDEVRPEPLPSFTRLTPPRSPSKRE